MAKLNKKVLVISVISMLFLGTYFMVSSQGSKQSQPNNSIFGRSVYEQNSDSNTVLGKTADPNYQMSFPKDHGAHDQFDIEWWYLTANLKDEVGNPYGLQWTLFRFRNPNSTVLQTDSSVVSNKGWNNNQIYMAHASIHSLNAHWFSEKFARGGVGNAGLKKLPFSLFIDDWQWLNSDADAGLFPATLAFSATDTSTPYAQAQASFTMKQTGPLVQHGENGFSVKSTRGHASHYYSAPFISIEGELTQIGEFATTQSIKLKGQAWFDQEWTSQLLDSSTQGWDWLSLHLDNGSKIMAFRMRLKNQEDYITGSYITSTGKQITLQADDLTLQPVSIKKVDGRQLPLSWNLTIPSKKVDLTISTLKDKQWNNASVPYYEGMVKIEGSHAGVGFLELTGY